jgi:hypothetical protein
MEIKEIARKKHTFKRAQLPEVANDPDDETDLKHGSGTWVYKDLGRIFLTPCNAAMSATHPTSIGTIAVRRISRARFKQTLSATGMQPSIMHAAPPRMPHKARMRPVLTKLQDTNRAALKRRSSSTSLLMGSKIDG